MKKIIISLIVMGLVLSSVPISVSRTTPRLVYEYVIITDRNLEKSNFQILIDYKSQYIKATIVTIEDIISNSSFWVNGTYGDATNKSSGNPWIEDGKEVKTNYSRFNDTQAKIRNFIRYAYSEWGTRYVLLGGDIQILPVRMLRINKARWYDGLRYKYISEDIPSDLYYATLHGTWNNDFDQYFGENKKYSTGEEADFLAEVYVGRAPVDNKDDVITFVMKVIHFETTIKPNHIQLHQSGINIFNFPDSTVIPEACDKWITDDYNVHKLYQVNEKITMKKWIKCFQEPEKLIVLHVGTGSREYYRLDYRIMYKVEFSVSDVEKLNNTFFPVHISIACSSGNFANNNSDCLAERLLLWSEGGPSACFFNSRYGFASRLDIHKYSGEFIEQQFYEIFQNGTEKLGEINQFAKEHFAGLASSDIGYRWCYYTVNLLGDPETSIFEKRNITDKYLIK